MRRPNGWGRLAGGLLLMVAMFGASLAPPATAQDGSSSIEIHNRVCPPQYAGGSFYDDCHSTPSEAGLPFTFASETIYERATNGDGNAGLANLPEGTYTITGVPPAELVDRVVHCSAGTAESNNQAPIDVTYVESGIQIYLPADTNVICDWYNVPVGETEVPTETVTATEIETTVATETETATATQTETDASSSIEVHNRICGPESEGQPVFEACHDNLPEQGIPYVFAGPISQEGVTNADGNVGFGNLPEGTYAITAGAPGAFDDRFVYCSVGTAETSNEAPIEVEYISGGVHIYLPASTNVICDWYDFPGATSSETATTTAETDVPATEVAGQDVTTETATAPDEAQTEATATETAESGPAATEPAEETGSQPTRLHRAGLFQASCDSLAGSTSAYLLNDLSVTSAEEQDTAVQRSTTTLPLPLEELLDAGYAVVVFYEDPSGTGALPVACGQVDGSADASASLELDLLEIDDSGYTGLLSLAPSSADSTQTDVSLLLTPVPSGEAADAMPAT